MKIICGTDFSNTAGSGDTADALTVQEKCEEVLGKTKLGFRGVLTVARQVEFAGDLL